MPHPKGSSTRERPPQLAKSNPANFALGEEEPPAAEDQAPPSSAEAGQADAPAATADDMPQPSATDNLSRTLLQVPWGLCVGGRE